MTTLDWNTFLEVDMRVGTIVEAFPFPEAKKPAYKLIIDFGPEIGRKKSSAQITTYYTTQELIGKQIIAVVNFAPKQIGPWMSECLVLGAQGNEGIVLLKTEQVVDNGQRIH